MKRSANIKAMSRSGKPHVFLAGRDDWTFIVVGDGWAAEFKRMKDLKLIIRQNRKAS